MTEEVQRPKTWVAPLLQRLTPAYRRRLVRKVGTALLRSQQKRIASQQDPEGILPQEKVAAPPSKKN